MAPIKSEPTELELRGVKLSVLVDAKALGLFQREFNDLRPIAISFVYDRTPSEPDVHGNPKQDGITISYNGPEDEKEGVITLACTRPDGGAKVLRILESLIDAEGASGGG